MTSVLHRIETSQLVYRANQLTGFHMTGNIRRSRVKSKNIANFKGENQEKLINKS